jgi:hypothetical protein
LQFVTTGSRANNATEVHIDCLSNSDTDDEPGAVDGFGDGFGWSKVLSGNLGNILPFDRKPKIAHTFVEEVMSVTYFKQLFTK